MRRLQTLDLTNTSGWELGRITFITTEAPCGAVTPDKAAGGQMTREELDVTSGLSLEATRRHDFYVLSSKFRGKIGN